MIRLHQHALRHKASADYMNYFVQTKGVDVNHLCCIAKFGQNAFLCGNAFYKLQCKIYTTNMHFCCQKHFSKLVDLPKCWKISGSLIRSASIQPRSGPQNMPMQTYLSPPTPLSLPLSPTGQKCRSVDPCVSSNIAAARSNNVRAWCVLPAAT